MQHSRQQQRQGSIQCIALALLAMIASSQATVLGSSFIAKEVLENAQARTANNLVGSLFAVLTTASTLGGLAQGGLAYANKDIRESAKQLLDGSLALSLAVDAMPLPALTKKAIKGNADRLKTISGSLLSLADGRLTTDLTGAMAKLVQGLEKDISGLADLAPSISKAFSPLAGDISLLKGPLAAFNKQAKLLLAAKGIKGAAAVGAGAAGAGALAALGGAEAGKLPGLAGELKGVEALLGSSNSQALAGVRDALKAFGVPDSQLLDLEGMRKEVREAINNIGEMVPRMGGGINLNITAPVAQPVTDALKAAASSGR